MKHRVYGKHLGRNKDQRRALFKTLVGELFLHGSIQTTEVKAEAVKGLVDKIINLAKNKKRQHLLQSYLINRALQDRLVHDIVPKLIHSSSGYTSLIKLGPRLGDTSMMVRMSLIGAEELKPLEKGIGSRVQGIVKKTKETKKMIAEKEGRTGQSVRKTKSIKRRTSRLSKTKK